jgi:hypothetical protein
MTMAKSCFAKAWTLAPRVGGPLLVAGPIVLWTPPEQAPAAKAPLIYK